MSSSPAAGSDEKSIEQACNAKLIKELACIRRSPPFPDYAPDLSVYTQTADTCTQPQAWRVSPAHSVNLFVSLSSLSPPVSSRLLSLYCSYTATGVWPFRQSAFCVQLVQVRAVQSFLRDPKRTRQANLDPDRCDCSSLDDLAVKAYESNLTSAKHKLLQPTLLPYRNSYGGFSLN
jgi:hypothetical protein